ncbi:MAG: sulfurtransferase TusA family protein [Rhodospirillales bacterium]|nr:sulfurtransferase TusA family protein [Rhodospirillales bacterium]
MGCARGQRSRAIYWNIVPVSSAEIPPTVSVVTLDITDDVCPMTFVRTRIELDRLPADGVLVVLLADGEPLENVPRSAAELGYRVDPPEPHPPGSGIWRITIRHQPQATSGG